MHRCKKHGHKFCWFCIGTTVAFPLEHLVWRLPVFRSIGALLGI